MLVSEQQFARVPDHAAELHAADRLARRNGRTVAEAIERHVDGFRRGWPPARAWIGQLTRACTRPPDLAGVRWAGAYVHGCVRLVAMIRSHAAGRLPDPCRGAPDQWRSRRRPDLQRAARRRGWRRVGCGRNTLHVFWDTGNRR